jgi:hypothetical protein
MKYEDMSPEKVAKIKEYQRLYQQAKKNNMTEEDRIKRNDYLKVYRVINREKINGYVNKWKLNLNEEMLEERKRKQKQYYENNKEKISQRAREKWATMSQEQKDRITANRKQRYRLWYFLLDDNRKRRMIDNSREWIDNHKQIHRERVNKYYQDNKKKKDESYKVPTTQPG